MNRQILKWKDPDPPLAVMTFEVDRTSQLLMPWFEYFRRTFVRVEEEPSGLFSRFVGIWSRSEEKLKQMHSLFVEFDRRGMAVWPRGSLDAKIVICGIAPGWTKKPYRESMWLLGPSSKIIFENMTTYEVYYTNIMKMSFEKNQYSDVEAEKWFDSFLQEMEIVQPDVVVFLGKYPIYRKVELPLSVEKVFVYHPAYFLRRGERERARDYILRALQIEPKPKPRIDTRKYVGLGPGVWLHRQLEAEKCIEKNERKGQNFIERKVRAL